MRKEQIESTEAREEYMSTTEMDELCEHIEDHTDIFDVTDEEFAQLEIDYDDDVDDLDGDYYDYSECYADMLHGQYDQSDLDLY